MQQQTHMQRRSPPLLVIFLKDSWAVVHRCYVTRTSLKCVSPGLSYGDGDAGALNGDRPEWAPNDDTRVCFQYSGIDSVPKEDQKSNDELYKQLEADLKEYGAQEVKVGRQLWCAAPVLLQTLELSYESINEVWPNPY